MQILVTGAPGWLGTRLVEALCRGVDGPAPFPNARVRCLVAPGMDPAPVRSLGAESVEGDLTRPETLGATLRGVELVFHVAGLVHAKRRTTEFFAINTEGTRNLLAASIAVGARRFVYVSSNSAAGVNLRRDLLMAEDQAPRPYAGYGRSKYLAEEAVRRAWAARQIETVIVRPCWFYGPNQSQRQTRFYRMIKSGRPLIFGDGQNLRSMCYVDNAVQGLILGARCEAAKGQIYWIADERPYKTITIYETVARLLGVPELKPRFIPNTIAEVFTWADRLLQGAGIYQTEIHVAGEMNKDIACSIDKAKRELGYSPTIALEEGVRRSIEWCRDHHIEI